MNNIVEFKIRPKEGTLEAAVEDLKKRRPNATYYVVAVFDEDGMSFDYRATPAKLAFMSAKLSKEATSDD